MTGVETVLSVAQKYPTINLYDTFHDFFSDTAFEPDGDRISDPENRLDE